MKEGKLKDYCQVIAGQSPNGSAYNESGEGMEFHQGKKAFGEYVIQSSNVWTTEITKIAEKGDILMSVRAPVGPTNMTDRKICIGRGLAAIRCSNKVLPHFVLYALKNIESRIVGNDGAVFNSINKKMIEDLPLPQCTIAEQERIVERLDAAFAQIDELKSNAERQLAEARALFQSALTQAMQPKPGWQEKKLSDICDVINGLWKGKKPPYIKVGVIRNANFTKSFTLRYDNIEYLDVEVRQYEKRKLQKGDLIVEKSGGSEKQPVGRAVLFEREDGEFSFSNFTSILRIKDKNTFLSKFLYYFLLFIYKRGDTFGMQRATTGIHNIEFEKYLNIGVPVLSLSEQQCVVDYLDALSKIVCDLEEISRKTAAECDALKQALLRQIFE